MKNKMFMVKMAVALFMVASLCCACGKNTLEDDKKINLEDSEADGDEETEETDTVTNLTLEADDSQDGPISDEKIEEFTEWAQRDDIYGFLLSEYTSPVDTDYNEVFYCGAGIAKSVDFEDDIYGDSFVILRSDMEEFLQERTGLSVDDLTYKFDWQEDAEHGQYTEFWRTDTNVGQRYECESGIKADDTYTLNFVPPSDPLETMAIENVVMQVRDAGNGNYVILSNYFRKDIATTIDAEYSFQTNVLYEGYEGTFHFDTMSPGDAGEYTGETVSIDGTVTGWQEINGDSKTVNMNFTFARPEKNFAIGLVAVDGYQGIELLGDRIYETEPLTSTVSKTINFNGESYEVSCNYVYECGTKPGDPCTISAKVTCPQDYEGTLFAMYAVDAWVFDQHKPEYEYFEPINYFADQEEWFSKYADECQVQWFMVE